MDRTGKETDKAPNTINIPENTLPKSVVGIISPYPEIKMGVISCSEIHTGDFKDSIN